ncbi:22187_t:CDS:10, partial [Entrophospora sp. SA101]
NILVNDENNENDDAQYSQQENIMNTELINDFVGKYNQMKRQSKWQLPSNKYAEDIIFEYAKNLSYESPTHSFIIDTENKNIKELFEDEDWCYITSHNLSSNPQIDDDLMNHIFKYRKVETHQMREVINSGLNIVSYDARKHYNHHYVHQVFSNLLPRYELRQKDFTSSHIEGWYLTNIWSVIIDLCLVDIEELEFIRASSERENRGRDNTNIRMQFGRRCDGIGRVLGSIDEFALSEEGKNWEGETAIGIDFVKKNHIEIIGFHHAAQHLKIHVMDVPAGYVCRLRSSCRTKIPSTLLEVDELITMVNEVLIAKDKEILNKINFVSDDGFKKHLRERTNFQEEDYEFFDSQKSSKKPKTNINHVPKYDLNINPISNITILTGCYYSLPIKDKPWHKFYVLHLRKLPLTRKQINRVDYFNKESIFSDDLSATTFDSFFQTYDSKAHQKYEKLENRDFKGFSIPQDEKETIAIELLINLMNKINDDFTKSHVLSFKIIESIKQFGWHDIDPLANISTTTAYEKLRQNIELLKQKYKFDDDNSEGKPEEQEGSTEKYTIEGQNLEMYHVTTCCHNP